MGGSKEDEIFEAIDKGTYKFALQQASKLVKKYPKSTYYKVLYNYTLFESGKVDQSVEASLKIMDQTPNDLDSLALLEKIFVGAGKERESLQIYENAIKKYPSLNLLISWFYLGCEKNDLKILQKSTMGLKGLQSSQRLFNLWAAFTSYLAAAASIPNDDQYPVLYDSRITPIERSLFPKLGLKIIESLRPLRNEQEVYVLVKLLQLNGLKSQIPKEIIQFTGENNKLDLELQIILLNTLSELKDYEELFKYSQIVLVDYKLDDFNTWKWLIESGLNTNQNDTVLKLIQGYNSRNSQLALIEYNVQNKSTNILESVIEYLNKFGHKNCAFLDIKQYIEYVDSSKFLEFLEIEFLKHTNEITESNLTWTVNYIKFKLYLDQKLFQSIDFINENISLFNKFKPLIKQKTNETDLFIGDEFILIIVQSILSQEFSTNSIIKSIIILENTITKDEHEFHLRLWLIQLYTLINCHTQAQFHYTQLKIKQVQHDILDHFLISRIGSIFPNKEILSQSYQIYSKSKIETTNYIKIGFEKGSFNKIQGILEFSKRLNHSFLQKHEFLQFFKIHRLFDDSASINQLKKQLTSKEINSRVYDNRDFKIFWDFGIHQQLNFKNKILSNIPQNDNYDKVQHFQESLIVNKQFDLKKYESLELEGLTSVEIWSLQLIVEAYRYLTGEQKNFDKVKSFYEKVPSIPNELSWKVSHYTSIIIETSKVIQSFTLNLNSNKKTNVSELKSLNVKLLNDVQNGISNKFHDIDNALSKLKEDLTNDEVLVKLEIKQGTINRIFDIISKSNFESFKVLRSL